MYVSHIHIMDMVQIQAFTKGNIAKGNINSFIQDLN